MALIILSLLLTFTTTYAAASDRVKILEKPIGVVFSGKARVNTLRSLKNQFPDLTDETPVSELATDTFYASLADKVAHKEVSNGVLIRLRDALAQSGVPANLTEAELAEFASNPRAPAYRRLEELPFNGYFGQRVGIARRLEANLIYFVCDFKKLYAQELALSPTAPFSHLKYLSEHSMRRANLVIDDFLQGRDSRIDLDALQLSVNARAALNSAGMSGKTVEEDLRQSPVSLPILAEITLAELVRRGHQESKVRRACQRLLLAWHSGVL